MPEQVYNGNNIRIVRDVIGLDLIRQKVNKTQTL